MFHSIPNKLGLLCFAIVATVSAQSHFKSVANTGSNATLAVPSSANPSILGAPLANGDEIAVFTPEGLCVGSTIWQSGQNAVIVAWGDNDQTQEIDGLRAGERMHFCVWRKSSDTGYGDVAAAFASGEGLYATNGIYVVASLAANAAVVPLPPKLASPSDGATGIASAPRLSWFSSCSATSYALQISTSPAFSTLVINPSGVDSTFYDFTGVASRITYYWRASATNSLGVSDWSAVRSFTTGMINAIEQSPSPAPRGFVLRQNYPNPMNPDTKIQFEIPAAAHVSLKIYDLLDREIRTLTDAPYQAGAHVLRWDGKDNRGLAAPSGIYVYRLRAGGFSEAKRVVLLR
ncbi:MAG: FlgD immunoglobulin-like domain containing protein [bacterium]